MCSNPENRAHFSKTINLRGHMPRFTQKWMFSHLSPWKLHKWLLEPSEQGSFHFSKMINLKGHMPRFTLKMMFSHGIPNVCLNPENSSFLQRWLIWDGHMPRFTQKWMFSHLSPWKPHKCVFKPWEQGSFHFSKTINLRGHMPRITQKWMFSHLSPWKPQKCVFKPWEQGSFFPDDWFEVSHA